MQTSKPSTDTRQVAGERPHSGSLLPKAPAADDPMRLRAGLVEGKPRAMLEGLIEEYARMGWNAERIARLFDNPFFRATHGLTRRFGHEAIRQCIEQTLQRCGVFRFDTVEPQPIDRPRRCPNPAQTLKP